jgi:hypothetical protein
MDNNTLRSKTIPLVTKVLHVQSHSTYRIAYRSFRVTFVVLLRHCPTPISMSTSVSPSVPCSAKSVESRRDSGTTEIRYRPGGVTEALTLGAICPERIHT